MDKYGPQSAHELDKALAMGGPITAMPKADALRWLAQNGGINGYEHSTRPVEKPKGWIARLLGR